MIPYRVEAERILETYLDSEKIDDGEAVVVTKNDNKNDKILSVS